MGFSFLFRLSALTLLALCPAFYTPLMQKAAGQAPDPWARPDGMKSFPKAPPVTVDDRIGALERRVDALERRAGYVQPAPVTYQQPVYDPTPVVAYYQQPYYQQPPAMVCGPNGCYPVQQPQRRGLFGWR